MLNIPDNIPHRALDTTPVETDQSQIVSEPRHNWSSPFHNLASLKSMMSHAVSSQVAFRNKCLNRDLTPEGYLNEVQDTINCGDLYILRSTCYYDNRVAFCPVMLEITDSTLKSFYGGNFLIQVWDRAGKKTFEQVLQDPYEHWNMMDNILIFDVSKNDQADDYYHIIFCDTNFNLKIKKMDWSILPIKYIAYHDDLLILASESQVLVADLSSHAIPEMMKNQETEYTVNKIKQSEYKIVDLGAFLMHGIFLYGSKSKAKVIFAFETSDNQIDFNQLDFSKKSEKIVIKFMQVNEMLQRQVEFDPIDKFNYIITNNRFYAVTTRRSQSIDLYRDLMKVETPDTKALDVDLSFEDLFIAQPDGSIVKIKTSHERFSYSLNEKATSAKNTTFYRCIEHLNLFQGVVNINETLFIAHGNIFSLYSIQEKQWIDHFQQEAEIYQVFRINDKQQPMIGMILVNGKVVLFEASDHVYYREWHQVQHELRFEGSIVRTVQDSEFDEFFLIFTKQGKDNFLLYAIHNKNLVQVKLKDINLEDLVDAQSILPLQGCKNKIIVANDGQNEIFVLDYAPKSGQNKVIVKEHERLLLPSKLESGSGKFHAVVTPNYEEMLVFVDEKRIQIFHLMTERTQILDDANFIKVIFKDSNYLYGFDKDESTNRCKFSVIVLNVSIMNDKLAKFDLFQLELKRHNFIDFDKFNDRLVYFRAFGKICITPPLHKNTLQFFGMANRDYYLGFKQLYEKVIGIDIHNCISMWSIVSGKLLTRHKFEQFDFGTGYEVYDETYKRGYFDKILLKSIEAAEGIDEYEFFTRNGFQYGSSIPHQDTYIEKLEKQFFKFSLIDITSENDVSQIMYFYHPKYKEMEQLLFFNEDNSMMLEILKSSFGVKAMVYVYPQIRDDGLVSWRMLRNLTNFPKELLEVSPSPFYFSPSFKYYIDFNPLTNEFYIVHTVTQIIVLAIPKHIIGDDESLQDKAKKLKFYKENQLIVINQDGVCKLVEFHVNTKEWYEISSYVIPFFKVGDTHYFEDPIVHPQSDILSRLQDRYKSLRQQRYLFEKTDKLSIYQTLFSFNTLGPGQVHLQKPESVMSFTFLSWKVIDQLGANEISLDDLPVSQIEELYFNIVPNCETVLHKIYKQAETVRSILKISLSEDHTQERMDIPFIRNLQGKTPIHFCLDEEDQKTVNIFLKELCYAHLQHHSFEIVDVMPQLVQNPTPALLNYLDMRYVETDWTKTISRGAIRLVEGQDYGVMTTNPWVSDEQFQQDLIDPEGAEVPIILRFLDLPRMHDFIEGKLQQHGDDLPDGTEPTKEKRETEPDDDPDGVKVSVEFFKGLAESPNLDIFTKESVRALIKFKWPLLKEWTIKKLMLPYIAYVFILTIYTTKIFFDAKNEDEEFELEKRLDPIFKILIFIFGIYFLKLEWEQLIELKASYFNSVWNFLDVFPPVLAMLLIIFDCFTYTSVQPIEPPLWAIVQFFMWLKFLYFFRIFEPTAYLIRMIIEVVIDMRAFMVVLIVSIIAFGNAFAILAQVLQARQENAEVDPFAVDGEEEAELAIGDYKDGIIYSYMGALGDFGESPGLIGEDDPNQDLVKILFFLSTVIQLIVLFNLLIAIISDTFARVQGEAISCMFQEMSNIIAENDYLIPYKARQAYTQSNKLLLFAKTTSAANEEEEVDHITEMKNEMVGQLAKIKEALTEMAPLDDSRLK